MDIVDKEGKLSLNRLLVVSDTLKVGLEFGSVIGLVLALANEDQHRL